MLHIPPEKEDHWNSGGSYNLRSQWTSEWSTSRSSFCLSITPELLLTCFLLLQKGILEQVSEVFWSTKTASFSQVKSWQMDLWAISQQTQRPRGCASLPGVPRTTRPQSLRKTWSCSCFYTFAQVTQCGTETSLGPGMLCFNAYTWMHFSWVTEHRETVWD